MDKYYLNKRILVTGAAGSIGSALVHSLLSYKPKIIRALDINETGLFNLTRQLHSGKVRPLVGDIRDKERLIRAVEDIDIVFHAAALKHVPLCEQNPFEAVQTNVLGTKNILEVSLDEEVEKFITISTDKAVNPINVLGASKLLAERLTVSANLYKGRRRTRFSCVRFGNVLNSQGSVLAVFKEQAKDGGPVTVTNEVMTRFIMSVDNAIGLVLKSAYLSKGGEIFVLKMPALRIFDLAKAIIEEAKDGDKSGRDIKIKIIGNRGGEKMFEELMNDDEAELVCETQDMFILSNAVSNGKSKGRQVTKIYKSKDCRLLEIGEIRDMLAQTSVLKEG